MLPKVITKEDVKELIEDQREPVLSVYMPMERVVVEPEENSLRLKNMLRTASELLLDKGKRRPEVDELLDPIRRLLGDSNFWRHQLEGLALFRTNGSFTQFRLPVDVPETCIYEPQPHVRPLFSALFPQGHFFVLALSQNALRLFEATRFGAREVDTGGLDVPHSLAEALRYDDLQKPELQHHPTTGPGRAPIGEASPPGSPGGQRRHGFHGHGESGEGQKTQIKEWFLQLDSVLSKALVHAGESPLMLAGVDFIRALYREVNNYPVLLADGIDGNPDQFGDGDIFERARPVIERYFGKDLDSAYEKFGSLESDGRASTDLHAIVDAADSGRVDTLFLRGQETTWGTFNEETRAVEVHNDKAAGDVDLLDLAARKTFMAAGTVYQVAEAPVLQSSSAAATFRY
jgi:hypothetical protein